jgi:effector-binding domain-containing protein
MFEDPTIEHRDEQLYAALSASITMDGFGVIGPLFAELIDWLAQRGIVPSASPFLRYLMIDMDNLLDVEVAVPIAVALPSDERVGSGTLPGGSYVTLHYRGDEHIAANTHLQEWAAKRGLRWKNSLREGRELWGGRIEISTPEGSETTVAYLVED